MLIITLPLTEHYMMETERVILVGQGNSIKKERYNEKTDDIIPDAGYFGSYTA